MDLAELDAMGLEQLRALAAERGLPVAELPRRGLLVALLRAEAEQEGYQFGTGILELLPEGWGFLRRENFQPAPTDVYVSQTQVKRFGMRSGDLVWGHTRPPKENEKYYSLLRVLAINAAPPEAARSRPDFSELTTVYPDERLILETGPEAIAARFIDLIAPIGKGQRGLIVSPPKAGKTTILKQIAASVATNNPEVDILVLLVDERPEEVTDIRRSVRGQVVSSTFDELPENHIRVSDLLLEQARRMVEAGRDVLLLLDSITRLSRASNLTVAPSGRTLSGGLDPAALHRPKRFFGAARNIEQGGSLTILATALVDTGSRLDEMIFEEFKGTGNWELHLSRELQERRIFPAIDVKKSGTRHDELLLDAQTLRQVWKLHRALASLDTVAATELLIDRLRHTRSNEEFLKLVEKTAGDGRVAA